MEMTLSQAADLIGVPQKRLYRAVKAGKLNAVQRHQGSRWEYLVTRQDLEEFERSTVRLVDEDIDRPRPTRRPVDQPRDRSTDPPTNRLWNFTSPWWIDSSAPRGERWSLN
jgi:excisionase family DNA binding protein